MTLPRAFQHALFPLALTLAACGTPPAAANTPPATTVPEVRLEPVVSGLEQPTSVVNPGDGSGRLFITQKTGLARVIENGELLDTPFLDLTGVVSLESEQGLLGLAFHPDYAENGRLFVHYNEDGDTVISEFGVSDDPNVAVATVASGRPVLWPQSAGTRYRSRYASGPAARAPSNGPPRPAEASVLRPNWSKKATQRKRPM